VPGAGYGCRASIVVVTRPVAMSYTWPETLTFGESRGEASSRSMSAAVPEATRRRLEELTLTFIGEGLTGASPQPASPDPD
jgi:hypothetical protein